MILDNADLLRQEAANALLKTIEEPPPESLIILVSACPECLLPTIRSRCQELRFAPLPISLVKDLLIRQRRLSDSDARFLPVVSGGRVGFALEANTEELRAQRAAFLELVGRDSLDSVAGCSRSRKLSPNLNTRRRRSGGLLRGSAILSL